MEGAEENREKIDLSLRMNVSSRYMLHGASRNQPHHSNGNVQSNGGEKGEEGEELQLSLGLSMNGHYGIDPATKKLRRSCSISNFAFSTPDNGSSHQAHVAAIESYAQLVRTCSLPAESEEEFRRRKDEQSARRLEVRMKRMEKKNARVARDKENYSEDTGNNENGGVNDAVVELESANGLENVNVVHPSSQGSIGSQRSGSSGFSDLQSQQTEGRGQNGEARSATSLGSVQVQVEQEPPVRAAAVKRTHSEVIKTTTVLDMPYVSTIEDGKISRIEGFLYKYKKGEEVKIVCVCHGLFLNPTEFIKHAGGGHVEHPLKHIIVNTSRLF